MVVVMVVWPERIMRSTPSITHGQDKKAIQQHYKHLQTLLSMPQAIFGRSEGECIYKPSTGVFSDRILSIGLSSSTS